VTFEAIWKQHMRHSVANDMQAHRGFSLLEVLLVIALTAAMAALSAPFLASSFSKNELAAASDQVVDALAEARSAAMHGRSGGKYGVHFETDRFVYFEGETYSAIDPDNTEHLLSGLVSVTDISISGGGSDIHFRSASGSSVETGSVQLTDSAGLTRTVSVNEAGLIDIE